jgi:DNA replication protein DnaC
MTETTTAENESPSATAEPSDAELIAKMNAQREAAKARGLDKLYRPAAQIATTLDEDLRLLGEVEARKAQFLGGPDTWEPECVTCKKPIGYTCAKGTYWKGRTLCDVCAGNSLEDRLEASGISFREIAQPLAALRNHDPDGKPYGEDYDRWLAFLKRFAALKPGERIDPPFAFAYGSRGVGKSAGAERALRDAIRNGCSGRAVKFRELVRRIVSTYGAKSKDDVDERADQIVRTYAGVHLLVIQEVGFEDHTDHNAGLFYDFVDERWGAKLPTIFTSNYSPEENSLGAAMTERTNDATKMLAIVDRLAGGFTKNGKRENLFFLKGKSWRGREIE